MYGKFGGSADRLLLFFFRLVAVAKKSKPCVAALALVLVCGFVIVSSRSAAVSGSTRHPVPALRPPVAKSLGISAPDFRGQSIAKMPTVLKGPTVGPREPRKPKKARAEPRQESPTPSGDAREDRAAAAIAAAAQWSLEDELKGAKKEDVHALQVLAGTEPWFKCAEQWEVCHCAGKVRFGAGNDWSYIELPKGKKEQKVECNTDSIPDPVFGVAKTCQCNAPADAAPTPAPAPPTAAPQAPAPPPAEEKKKKKKKDKAKDEPAPTDPPGEKSDLVWLHCAQQWTECICPGEIRWGNGDKWQHFPYKEGGGLNKVMCSIQKLQDIAPGDEGKHCDCGLPKGSPAFATVNPALVPGQKVRLATSCEIFEKGKSEMWPHGEVLWEAVEPFCSIGWEDRAAKDPLLAMGSKAMPLSARQELMKAWIDPRFNEVYDRHFETGWTQHAFVNYYAGHPGTTHMLRTDRLIKSVHKFSKAPIIVVHFGFTIPDSWTPEKYPQLVLLHAAPIPEKYHRSFNFNKFRAILMSRALVGIQLDSDQFVAPGVDMMFNSTAKEITKEYPMPILPVHFLDRGPQDGGCWWQRFCDASNACPLQTTRWGHAHPTWTFWATPFFGKWLRRNFRDESLPPHPEGKRTTGGAAFRLRITDIPEDEDLLNVATWEDKGTKQWCKLDIPDPSEFDIMLDPRNKGNKCGSGMCWNIGGDQRWHKEGAAKVFITAHHAVNIDATDRYIQKLEERFAKDPLPPILFNQRFFWTGEEMRKAFPSVSCQI